MEYIKSVFTFPIEYLWNVSKLRSANIANHIINSGASQERNLALTESERDLWNVSIRYPADRVYNYLLSAGKVQRGTYEYDLALADGTINIRYTLYLHSDWDTNLTRGLNNLIEQAIVSGGLADWYKSSMSIDAYAILNKEYEDALAQCKQNINRRKSRTTRPHVTF
jgi:hypothetical protein